MGVFIDDIVDIIMTVEYYNTHDWYYIKNSWTEYQWVCREHNITHNHNIALQTIIKLLYIKLEMCCAPKS